MVGWPSGELVVFRNTIYGLPAPGAAVTAAHQSLTFESAAWLREAGGDQSPEVPSNVQPERDDRNAMFALMSSGVERGLGQLSALKAASVRPSTTVVHQAEAVSGDAATMCPGGIPGMQCSLLLM